MFGFKKSSMIKQNTMFLEDVSFHETIFYINFVVVGGKEDMPVELLLFLLLLVPTKI